MTIDTHILPLENDNAEKSLHLATTSTERTS